MKWRQWKDPAAETHMIYICKHTSTAVFLCLLHISTDTLWSKWYSRLYLYWFHNRAEIHALFYDDTEMLEGESMFQYLIAGDSAGVNVSL